MLLPTNAAEAETRLFFLPNKSVQAESPLCSWEELKYKTAGTYLCLLVPKSLKEAAAALPASSGTGSQRRLGMPARQDHGSFFPRQGYWREGCLSSLWGCVRVQPVWMEFCHCLPGVGCATAV